MRLKIKSSQLFIGISIALAIGAISLFSSKAPHVAFPVSPSLVNFPLDSKLRIIRAGSGKFVSLREILKTNERGIILNFWGTWCPPCIEELPSLEYLNRKIKNVKNLPTLVTVSVDEKPEEIFALFRTLDFSVSLTILHDPLGKVAQQVGVTKFPETFWLSSSGEVKHKWVGPQSWLSADVLRVLGN